MWLTKLDILIIWPYVLLTEGTQTEDKKSSRYICR